MISRSLVLCAAMLVAGCSGSLANVPSAFRSSLQPLVDDGFSCAGPSRDNSDYSQWTCDKSSGNGILFHVVMDGDEAGIRQIIGLVDQSRQETVGPAPLLPFFDLLTRTPLGGPSEEIQTWIATHVSSGGQEQFGPVFVTLDTIAPVTHLSLFVQPTGVPG